MDTLHTVPSFAGHPSPDLECPGSVVDSVVYASRPADVDFPVQSWVGTAGSCTGLAWEDGEQLGSFALVTDSGLGLGFEPEHELGLELGLPDSSVVVVASDGRSTAYFGVQVASEEMALVGGEAV